MIALPEPGLYRTTNAYPGQEQGMPSFSSATPPRGAGSFSWARTTAPRLAMS
jgi:hypothetical protein